MQRRTAAAPLLATVLAAVTAPPADAARFCSSEGFLTYTGSTPALSRESAERSALIAWRAAGPAVGRSREGSVPPRSQMQCTRSGDRGEWRCYIRAGRCKRI